jgi:hypothetical protein
MTTNCNPLAWCSHKCMIPDTTTPELLLAHDISERGQSFQVRQANKAVDFLTTQGGEALHEVLNMPKTTASCTLMIARIHVSLVRQWPCICCCSRLVPERDIQVRLCPHSWRELSACSSINRNINPYVLQRACPECIQALTGSLIKFVLESSGKYPSLVIQREAVPTLA